MSRLAISIQFRTPAPSELMGRALNFIEDVSRFAEKRALGSVDQIDEYGSGLFIVRVNATRNIGAVRSGITSLLRKHMLEEEALVSRGDAGCIGGAHDA